MWKQSGGILAVAFAAAATMSAPAAAGTIRGAARFSGEQPPKRTLDTARDPGCGLKSVPDESVLLSEDGKALRNVVVRLTDAPATPAPAAPVVLEQRSCTYQPRIAGAVEGQRIEVRNGDQTTHNVRAVIEKRTLFNRAQPPRGAPVSKALPKNAGMVDFKCDMHPWMTAFVIVSPHPYFAVTDAQGAFEIRDVPPGTYTAEAWHEVFGTRTAKVTVTADQPARLDFQFTAQRDSIAGGSAR